MAGKTSNASRFISALEKFVQFDLFDALPGALVEVQPQTELPKVLARHPHGVQLGQHFVSYQLQRSKRRTIGFQITASGLQVTAPRWVSLAEIKEALESKQRWILKHLQEQANKPAIPPPAPTVWTSGAKVPYLGADATLHVDYGSPTRFDPDTRIITLNLPADSAPDLCRKHLLAWLMREARREFSERLPVFAQQLGVRYHSFSLSSAGTTWGTCNINGKIRLNWRLIHFAPHLIDYVIAHELSHLHEMNHSAKFWAMVGSVYPDYAAARSELNSLGLKTLPDLQ